MDNQTKEMWFDSFQIMGFGLLHFRARACVFVCACGKSAKTTLLFMVLQGATAPTAVANEATDVLERISRLITLTYLCIFVTNMTMVIFVQAVLDGSFSFSCWQAVASYSCGIRNSCTAAQMWRLLNLSVCACACVFKCFLKCFMGEMFWRHVCGDMCMVTC